MIERKQVSYGVVNQHKPFIVALFDPVKEKQAHRKASFDDLRWQSNKQ